MAITAYISKERARINATLNALDDTTLDIYIDLSSQWLDQNIVLDEYATLNDVPAEVQQATVQLCIKFLDLETLNPGLAKNKEKLGDYEYEQGLGRSSYATWWLDLSTILRGYQLKPLLMSPQIVT